MVASGPAGPRRRLGAELRRLRTGKGLHLDAVADQLRCSASKVSRLETGKGIPKQADVRALIRLYDVTGDAEREMLLRLVHESRAEGWWQSYIDGIAPERFVMDLPERYTALETEACAIRSFDPVLIHGLLQVPDYARHVMRTLLPNHPLDEIEQLVELRVKRQEALTLRTPPLEFTAVVDEAVLSRPIGSRAVMVDQLRALLAMGRLDVVTIVVLPFDIGLRRAQMGRFDILEFADDAAADVVFIEGHGGATLLESASDVDLYKDVLTDAVDHALDPDATRALIARYLDEYVSS